LAKSAAASPVNVTRADAGVDKRERITGKTSLSAPSRMELE
jgi:hypothetical protein